MKLMHLSFIVSGIALAHSLYVGNITDANFNVYNICTVALGALALLFAVYLLSLSLNASGELRTLQRELSDCQSTLKEFKAQLSGLFMGHEQISANIIDDQYLKTFKYYDTLQNFCPDAVRPVIEEFKRDTLRKRALTCLTINGISPTKQYLHALALSEVATADDCHLIATIRDSISAHDIRSLLTSILERLCRNEKQ